MSLTKRLLEQLDEDTARGYSVPERGKKYLCYKHYSDRYINQHIYECGAEGKCSYCKSRCKVLDFSYFVEYVGAALSDYLVSIEEANLPYDSTFIEDDDDNSLFKSRCGFAVPSDVDFFDDTDDVMSSFGLLSNSDELNRDLKSHLLYGNRIRRNPTSLSPSEELSMMWQQFSEYVRTKQRFTFFRSWLFDENHLNQSDNGLGDILSELGVLVHHVERTIKEGDTLYRCRPADSGETVVGFDDITAPPAVSAKSNRLSPAGISMFYGSFDRNTAIREVEYATTKKLVYLGTFKTTRPLRVIDMCSNQHISFWMPDESWQVALFLKHFHEEISKAISPDDNSEVEYTPSQIFTEYLRYLCKDSDGSNYDGIIYKSAITGCRNVVLFYDQKASASVLSLDGDIERIVKL